MNFLFAWRYFNAKKSTNAINIIAWTSVVAMATGTAALIILLSVFNGFEDLVKSLYADFYTDLRIIPASAKNMQLSPEQQHRLANWPGVKAISYTLEEKALLQNGSFQGLVYMKGVDSNYHRVNNVARRLIRGKFLLGNADKPDMVMGAGVENMMGIESDRALLPLTVYLPGKGIVNMEAADPLQSLSADNIVSAGSFAIQEDFDNNYVITNLGFIKRMMGLSPQTFGAAEISLAGHTQPDDLQKSLQDWLGKNYRVQTMYQQNSSLYSTMRREKWFIFVLLSFILVVAAFTMIGALTMLILEKQKDIQILKAMGSHTTAVQKIFLSEGLLLALVGGGGGIILALLIGWLQVKYKLVKLGGNTFLIDHYPVKFLPGDIILVFLTVLLIALLASWFPSYKAAHQPIALKS